MLRKPDHGRRARLLRPRPRRDDGRRRAHDGAGVAGAGERGLRPARHLRRRRSARSRRRSICRRPSPGLPPTGCTANSRRSASTSPPIRSTSTRRRCRRCGCRPGRSFRRPSSAAPPPAGSPAPSPPSRSARRAPATRWASSQFSDTSGQYEAVLFSEGLAQYRDLLEPGRSVVDHRCGRGPAGRHQSAHPDGAVAGGRGKPRPEGAAHLRARRRRRSARWPASLRSKGEGQVSFVVIKEGGQGEVEIELPDRYRSRRRSPRRCARCRAWSRWSWCRRAANMKPTSRRKLSIAIVVTRLANEIARRLFLKWHFGSLSATSPNRSAFARTRPQHAGRQFSCVKSERSRP